MTLKPHPTPALLPEVNFSEQGDVRHLHLGTPWVQGSMLMSAPFDLELEYVRRMMVGLLFVDLDQIAQGHAMQLGLGAGALTKFCYKKLGMRTTAIELNPQVLAVCRQWFKLPPNDARLAVVLADAAQEIQKTHYAGTVDVLHVDLYDDDAAAPVLNSANFYADCAALLSHQGVMTVNLFGRDTSCAQSLEKISLVFGAQAVWVVDPTREGNTIVLAQKRARRAIVALFAVFRADKDPFDFLHPIRWRLEV